MTSHKEPCLTNQPRIHALDAFVLQLDDSTRVCRHWFEYYYYLKKKAIGNINKLRGCVVLLSGQCCCWRWWWCGGGCGLSVNKGFMLHIKKKKAAYFPPFSSSLVSVKLYTHCSEMPSHILTFLGLESTDTSANILQEGHNLQPNLDWQNVAIASSFIVLNGKPPPLEWNESWELTSCCQVSCHLFLGYGWRNRW